MVVRIHGNICALSRVFGSICYACEQKINSTIHSKFYIFYMNQSTKLNAGICP